MPGPGPGAGGIGPMDYLHVPTGNHLLASLTRIQASFCRRKEGNSPELSISATCY